jgi:diacylglycerol O-acyltransferase-1
MHRLNADYPLVNAGASKGVATTIVFTFSALLHEVVISVPFRHVSLHAFFGMLAQAPLIAASRALDRTFENAFLGNVVFWCLFCVIGKTVIRTVAHMYNAHV